MIGKEDLIDRKEELCSCFFRIKEDITKMFNLFETLREHPTELSKEEDEIIKDFLGEIDMTVDNLDSFFTRMTNV